jgi:hypothetical protein
MLNRREHRSPDDAFNELGAGLPKFEAKIQYLVREIRIDYRLGSRLVKYGY